jgi:hypothetical protein
VASWFVGERACVALWLYASGGFVRAKRDGGAIIVTRQDSPFACSLEKSLTKEQREHKKQIAWKMEKARIGTQELPDGYVFRFRPEGISLTEVADWVATERVCCPFLIWRLKRSGRMGLCHSGLPAERE